MLQILAEWRGPPGLAQGNYLPDFQKEGPGGRGLTSVLCKISEKLLKKALLLFLTETRSLSPSQYGFLPRRSCLSTLILQEER